MPWSEPRSPVEPSGEIVLQTLRHAFLTAVERGPIRALQRPDVWFRGAVHDSTGLLKPASQRICGIHGHRSIACDPRRVAVPRRLPRRQRLRGRWLYGGSWLNHFGHFLVESLPTLWPDPTQLGPLDGLVFHRGLDPRHETLPWQQELVALAGYGDLPVHVVSDDPVGVEELLLPSRTVALNAFAHPQARELWLRASGAAGGAARPGPQRVFLSRTKLHRSRREADPTSVRSGAEEDERFDAVFAGRGFEVVAPERLPVLEQVRLARGAEILAGMAGSALHLAAFAGSGTRVLELGDSRSSQRPLPMQQVVNAVCGHRAAFLPHGVEGPALEDELDALGLAGATEAH